MGVLDRLVLSYDERVRIAPLITGRPDRRALPPGITRYFLEACSGLSAPVRLDLSEAFGEWSNVLGAFSRWSATRVWWRIVAAMANEPDMKY